jgi:hypothetical protein
LGMAKLTNLSLATAFECLVVEQALSVNDWLLRAGDLI